MKEYDRREERTGVQEGADFEPIFDVQSDFVMVYGFHNLKERVKKWKKAGYVIHLMTGVAWGEYQDYLFGRYDGVDHHDEGLPVEVEGLPCWFGVLYLEQPADLVPQHVNEFVEGHVLVPLHPLFEAVHDLQGRIDTHVGSHQGLFDGIKHIVIDLGSANYRSGEPLEETFLRLLDASVKKSHNVI